MYKYLVRYRWLIIVAVGLLANSYYRVFYTKIIYGGFLKGLFVPFLNCYACPTAYTSCALASLQEFASAHMIPFFVIGVLGVIGIFFGRAACGWLCPFGLLQDWLNKIKSPKISLPNWTRNIKYVFLVGFVLILPYFTSIHWFSRLCPDGTLIAGIPWLIWNPNDPVIDAPYITEVGLWYYLKIAILIAFIVASILIKRPFCRTMCPLGAIYGLFNKISFFHLELDDNKCTNCKLCNKSCPMDLDVVKKHNSPDCIRCLQCTVSSCSQGLIKPKFKLVIPTYQDN